MGNVSLAHYLVISVTPQVYQVVYHVRWDFIWRGLTTLLKILDARDVLTTVSDAVLHLIALNASIHIDLRNINCRIYLMQLFVRSNVRFLVKTA
jgi:hypothetical protein